jgi:hypothetical protein
LRLTLALDGFCGRGKLVTHDSLFFFSLIKGKKRGRTLRGELIN